MDLSNEHLYTQSIFNSALMAHDDDEYIRDQIKIFYPNATHVEIYRNNTSQAYYMINEKFGIITLNATDGTAADWKHNFDARVDEHFHVGIHNEYKKYLAQFVLDSARDAIKKELPIKLFGHSQGDGHCSIACTDIEEHFYFADVEAVGTCGPRMCTPAGIKRMKKAGCRVTHMFNYWDIVSMIGGIIKWFPLKLAVHYGHKVKFPKYKQHVPIKSHSWLQVMFGLNALYDKWGQRYRQKAVNAIINAEIAIK